MFLQKTGVLSANKKLSLHSEGKAVELYFRHEKLGEFIGSEKFALVSETQKVLLKRQYDEMTAYGKTLDERIVDIENEK